MWGILSEGYYPRNPQGEDYFVEVPGKVNHWRSRTIINLLVTNLLFCGVDLPLQELFLAANLDAAWISTYVFNEYKYISISIEIYTTMINYMWHKPNIFFNLIYHMIYSIIVNPNTYIWHRYVLNQFIDQYIDQYVFCVHFFCFPHHRWLLRADSWPSPLSFHNA